MRRPALVGTLAAVAFCGGCAERARHVVQHGEMRAVMRDGRTEGRVELHAVTARPHAYAVGALEGLHGEITIVDGATWVARVADDGPQATGPQVTGPRVSPGDRATLLTVAHVDAWRTSFIDEPLTGATLERFVRAAALDAGLDPAEPFPFLIEGGVTTLSVHVINGSCPVAGDPATIAAQPWRLTLEDRRATIVGFHAEGSAGVMTHHGSNVHMHAVVTLDGRTLTGHVDEVSIDAGAVLSIPGE